MNKRLIFVTTFDYPSRYAHPLHGLFMARAFARVLGDHFLFFINTTLDVNIVHGIQYRRLFGPWGRRIKKLHLRKILLPFSLLWFFATHRAWRGSHIFVNDLQLLTLLRRRKWFYDIPIIFECHEVLSPPQAHLVAHYASLVIFVTNALREEFIKLYPHIRSTLVLPNAVDTAAFEAVSADQASLKRELQLPEVPLVGYVSRLNPRGEEKGIETLIDAMALVSEPTKLLLVGGTAKEIEEYKKYTAHKKLQDRVLFVPHVAP